MSSVSWASPLSCVSLEPPLVSHQTRDLGLYILSLASFLQLHLQEGEEDSCCWVSHFPLSFQVPWSPSSLSHLYLKTTSGHGRETVVFSSLSPFWSIRLKWSVPPGQRTLSCLVCGGGGGFPWWYFSTFSRMSAVTYLQASAGATLSFSQLSSATFDRKHGVVLSSSQPNLASCFIFVPVSRSSRTSWATIAEVFQWDTQVEYSASEFLQILRC